MIFQNKYKCLSKKRGEKQQNVAGQHGEALVQPEVRGEGAGAEQQEVRQGGEGGEAQAQEGHRKGEHGGGQNTRRERHQEPQLSHYI